MASDKAIPEDLYKKIYLGRKVLLAMLFGVLTGIFLQLAPESLSQLVLPVIALGGTMFLELLKMIVIPLVVTALYTGVVQTGPWRSLRPVLVRSLLYFIFSSMLAVLVGLVVVNLVPVPLSEVGSVKPGMELTSSAQKAVEGNRVTTLFSNLIPSYPLDALATSDILGIMLFTGLFAYFTLQVTPVHRDRVVDFVYSCDRVVHKVTYAVVSLDPYGVFCLITVTVAGMGYGEILPLLGYLGTVLGAFALFSVIVLPCLLWAFTKTCPLSLARNVFPALITAFSTTSSTATLPLTLECSTHLANLSPRISGIVLPLGAHLNVCGRALFEGVTVVFIARTMGVELSWWIEARVLLASLALSVGGSGLPHSGLQVLGVVLSVVGLPPHLAGMVVGVDKLVAMVSSSTTVWSNVVGAAIVEHGIRRNKKIETM